MPADYAIFSTFIYWSSSYNLSCFSGLQVAQGPGQEVQSKNQGREVQPRVMDIEVTAVQVIKEDKSNNKK